MFHTTMVQKGKWNYRCGKTFTCSIPEPQINSAPIDDHICTKIVKYSWDIILFGTHSRQLPNVKNSPNSLIKLIRTYKSDDFNQKRKQYLTYNQSNST